MIFVFNVFAALLVWLSLKSFRSGLAYLKFFEDELAKPPSEFTPFVSVIVPCRGLDDGLEQNLIALIEQDYPDYEVIFVVDDPADPAVEVIKAETRLVGSVPLWKQDFPRLGAHSLPVVFPPTRLVVAPKAHGCSQKVENLREAVLHVADLSRVFVFVDSDARPSKDWLRHLVAPLEDENVGAATGYRWYIAKNPTFGSEMRSVWNASIASALGSNTRSNFCWGGSTAIRRDVFDAVGMREKWRGTLSDDFAVTRAMNAAGRPIVFVPQAVTASIEDSSLLQTIEFTNRQMKITRVYATPLWLMSFIGSVLFIAVMLAAFLIVILDRTNSLPVWIGLSVLFLVTFFSVGKAWLRLRAVRLVLTDYKAKLKHQFWLQTTLWLLSPVLFLINCIAAALSKRMTWRGITYELKSPTETVIIRGE